MNVLTHGGWADNVFSSEGEAKGVAQEAVAPNSHDMEDSGLMKLIMLVRWHWLRVEKRPKAQETNLMNVQ